MFIPSTEERFTLPAAWVLISQQICLIHSEINSSYCMKEINFDQDMPLQWWI